MLPLVSHTLNILGQLTRDLPPLTPLELQRDIRDTYTALSRNNQLSAAESEAAVITSGKKIWPYRRAFQEITTFYEHKIGEIFLTYSLTEPLKDRYRAFTAAGGCFQDAWSGRSAAFFFADDRPTLTTALIATQQYIRAHAAQAALSVARPRYENRIEELSRELEASEKELYLLRSLANQESDPSLAKEIQAHIQACDYGFCGLGPAVTLAAISQAREHFQGRKEEKLMTPNPLFSLDFNHAL